MMAVPFLLLASLATFSDERVRAPAAPQEQCVELRQFRANGGCRVAVDRSLAWMCISEVEKMGDFPGKFHVSFKSEGGAIVKQFDYDKRQTEGWEDHAEIFYMASDARKNPDLKIGLAKGTDSQVIIGKSRYCLPAEGAKQIKR